MENVPEEEVQNNGIMNIVNLRQRIPVKDTDFYISQLKQEKYHKALENND